MSRLSASRRELRDTLRVAARLYAARGDGERAASARWRAAQIDRPVHPPRLTRDHYWRCDGGCGRFASEREGWACEGDHD